MDELNRIGHESDDVVAHFRPKALKESLGRIMSSSFEPNAFLPRKAPPSQPPPGFVPAKIAAPCPAFKAPPAAQLIKIVFQAQLVYSGGPNIVTFSGSVSTASTARMLGHIRVGVGFCTWA